MNKQEPKSKTFDVLRFVADNAGLSTLEAIEKAYNMGLCEQEPCDCSTCANKDEVDGSNCYECVKGIQNNYKQEPCEMPCEMTAEEYRQRMMQAFHNADCGELIAVCVLPTEKEFEHLEWLLKNHYKKEPCKDAISRQAVLDMMNYGILEDNIETMPSVTPQPKTGQWILQPSNKDQDERDFIWWKCSECGQVIFSETERDRKEFHAFCGRCGAKMA